MGGRADCDKTSSPTMSLLGGLGGEQDHLGRNGLGGAGTEGVDAD